MESDKGQKTVVMYKRDYLHKMTSLLDDRNTYKTLRTDPTNKLITTNNNIITDLYKQKLITIQQKKQLLCSTANAPRLYGLPKIHKSNVPLRPIADSTMVPCYKLSKYVGKEILKPLISSDYNIKNSSELLEKLKHIKLEDNEILISFDVISLFTNIPTNLATKIILEKWDIIKNTTNISKAKFSRILDFCLKDNNYLIFDDQIYQQVFGMPMGNPLSPTIADIVLDKLLDEAIAELKTMGITFKFITKYVDDIFAVIKKFDKEIILTTLNNFHPKIKFTYEEELDHKLPYLDIEIIKRDNNLIFNWYSKDISSGRLINFHSSQPMSQKLGTVKNFIKKTN
ncbi:uncharacterized protein LOC119675315 [Teleopsis dalmanni]|uniref:uncharacterized protein LOC119675315 n=1 Tax=Teleopsis dalmanni TaxID=139649 RepID=UPI0018CD143C|nr:uncharacterized protein LOC119675315 [Teleopsis dalmanni]